MSARHDGPDTDAAPARVLLVEDDAALRTMLRSVLAAEGYEVLTATSVAEGTALLAHAAPALLVLDLGLPDGDGSALLARARAQAADGTVATLVVSARDDEATKIDLLDTGADDYLVKPFGAGELLARIRVALRRRGRPHDRPQTRYAVDGLVVDVPARRVERDAVPVHLTPTEFALLARLVRDAGRVVTHRRLLADAWGGEAAGRTHYLRIYMAALRRKLEADPAEPRWLLTEAGVGYRLAGE